MRIEPIEDAIRRRTLGRNWPKLADFERDSVFVPTKIVNDLLYGLRIKRHAILLGTEGRGKSTAAEVLGFRLKQSGDRVYMIDCEYESPQTTDQIGTAIINKDSSATLWIIDGIQLDADGIAALYEYIESTRKARFLFVWTRELPSDIRKIISEEDWLDEVLEKSTVVSMVPTEETIREIITSFVNGHPNERRFADTTFLQNITPDYLSNVLKLTGGNLRTLIRYLQIWDPRTEPLDAMGPEQILDYIQEDRLKPLLNVGDDLLRTYVAIAAAYQFDIPVSADAGTPFIIRELEARGLIENSGSAFYRLPHSSDARDVIRAFASMTGKTPSAVTDANLPNDRQLKEWRLSHSLRLMKGLREASWYSPSRVVQEQFGVWAIKSRIDVKTQYIRSFCKDPTDLKAFIKKIGGQELVKEVATYTTMPKLREFFAAVRHIDEQLAEELESALSLDDKVAMYSRTKLSSLAKSLKHYAQDEKSRYFANKILGEIMNQDFASRIERASIRTCGRLVWGATQINKEKAGLIGETIAQHVSLSTADNAEELSLLIRNLSVNESARLRFIQRITTECQPEMVIADGKPDGYSFLITAIGNHLSKLQDQGRALRFFSYFATTFPAETIKVLNDESLAAAIWNVWRVGEPIEPFLQKFRKNIVSRLREAQGDSLLWLLWSLLQASEPIYKQIIAEVKPDIERRLSGKSLGASDLAVAGLLNFTATPLSDVVLSNLADDIGTILMQRPVASKILLALLGAKQAGEGLYQKIRSEMEAGGIELGKLIDKMIDQTNIAPTQARLRSIANQLELSESQSGPSRSSEDSA